LDERQYQSEWDEIKAAANVSKHGISFELASTIFGDPGLFTAAALEHSPIEERWISVGFATYLWSESKPPITKVRLISARRATPTEIRQYEENQ
jgi:uncharacterized DUF497 family protein